MKLPFRHGKAEPRNEPIAAMIKRVADEHRLRGGAGATLTPASVLGEAAQPRPAAAMASPSPAVPVAAPEIAARAPASPSPVQAADAPRAAPAPAPATPRPRAPMPSPSAPVAATTGDDLAFVTCGRGHRFVRLADHPAVDGIAACPHCMAKTLGDYRKIFAAIVRPVKYE